jgi:hypothetical protein
MARPKKQKGKKGIARGLAKRRPSEVGAGAIGVLATALIQIFDLDAEKAGYVAALVGFVPSIVSWAVDTTGVGGSIEEEEEEETDEDEDVADQQPEFDDLLKEFALTAKSVLEKARVVEDDWGRQADALSKVAPLMEQARGRRRSDGARKRR